MEKKSKLCQKLHCAPLVRMQNVQALWKTAQQFHKMLSYHVDQQFHSEGHTQENWKQTRRHTLAQCSQHYS